MKFRFVLLSVALLAGSWRPGTSQTKPVAPPDPAMVKRTQDAIAQAESRGDLPRAQRELRFLLILYRNDPAMQRSINASLAQVTAQIQSSPKPTQTSTSAPPLNSPPATASIPTTDIFAAPVPAPQVSGAGVTPQSGNATSGADTFSKILASAAQIIAQAQQMRKEKEGNGPQPGPQILSQQTPFPAAPDGPPADTQAPTPVPADLPVAAGVVIGYDANNQPIFAPPQDSATPPK